MVGSTQTENNKDEEDEPPPRAWNNGRSMDNIRSKIDSASSK